MAAAWGSGVADASAAVVAAVAGRSGGWLQVCPRVRLCVFDFVLDMGGKNVVEWV